jgi:WD40 repeat protein
MKLLRVPSGRFTAVCYSPDGRYLLALQSGWRLRAWETATLSERFVGKLPGTLYSHQALALVGNLAVGTRGVYDLSDVWATLAQAPGLVRRNDLIREVALRELESSFAYVCYCTDGGVIVRTLHNYPDRHLNLTIWNLERGLLRSLSLPYGTQPGPLVESDRRFLVVLEGRIARLHDSTTGEEICRLGHTDNLQVAAFSPDGNWLATGAGRSLWLWELASRKGERYPAFQKHISAVAFHPDSTFLAGADRTGEVRVLATTGGHVRACLNFEVGSINGLAFSPDGMTIAGAAHRSSVVVWDLE